MKKRAWLIIIIAAVLILGWFWTSYNRLVAANENCDNQWANVETQYQRRFDLVPQLVNSVKGAMAQEQTVFGDIAAARANYAGATTVDQKVSAINGFEGSLSRLLVIMENYPQLKSVEAVQTLMAQLEGTENRVSVERSRYNDQVKIFNVMVKRFPTNLLASVYGFSIKEYFQSVPEANAAPKVDLEINR